MSRGEESLKPAKAALDYARRDWPVFPCRPNDKIPLVKAWGKTASTDPQQIEAWWRRWPDALIGVPTGERSGLVILDIDVKHGKNGFDTLAELGRSILPDTPIAHTRSGGVHLYFARDPILKIRNSVGEHGLGPGLDVRGEGGFVVAPDGRPGGYWWDPHWNLDTAQLMPVPGWLGHRSQKDEGRRRSATGERFDPHAILDQACAAIERAGVGTRHDTVLREVRAIASLVKRRFLEERDARHRLEAAALTLVDDAIGNDRYGRKAAERDFADAWDFGIGRSAWR
jgi:hypothetical protein